MMNKEQLKHTEPIELGTALRMAFDAGCSYGTASHKDFVQIHEPKGLVCDALARRIVWPTSNSIKQEQKRRLEEVLRRDEEMKFIEELKQKEELKQLDENLEDLPM